MLSVVGVTITPKRDAGSGGNPDWQDLPPIPHAVFALTNPARMFAREQPDRPGLYLQDGSLFVPRGSDLQDGDRVDFQGKSYAIVGDALWDMDHPFTDDDLGYVEFVIRKGG